MLTYLPYLHLGVLYVFLCVSLHSLNDPCSVPDPIAIRLNTRSALVTSISCLVQWFRCSSHFMLRSRALSVNLSVYDVIQNCAKHKLASSRPDRP